MSAKDTSEFSKDQLHTITEIANAIRNKTYGEDTREAMAQSLEKMASLVGLEVDDEEFVQMINAQLAHKANQSSLDGTNTRIDNLIIESGGDSNIEVADARTSSIKDKTFPTLTNRFDDIESDTYYPVTNLLANSNFQIDTDADGIADNWSLFRVNSAISNTYIENGVQHFTGSGINPSTTNWFMAQDTNLFEFDGREYFIKIRAKKMNTAGSNQLVIANGHNDHFSVNLEDEYKDFYFTFVPLELSSNNFVLVFKASNQLQVAIENVVLIDTSTIFNSDVGNKNEVIYRLISQFKNAWFEGKTNLFNAPLVLRAISQVPTSSSRDKLVNDILGTRQSVSFDNERLSRVEHIDIISGDMVRVDTYTYNDDVIKEERVLANGDKIFFNYNLSTFETEVLY